MHYLIRQGSKSLFFTCFYLLIIFIPITTEASLIDDVTIEEAGLLNLVDGAREIIPGVKVKPVNGHTTGSH